jgi:hypothetical protein
MPLQVDPAEKRGWLSFLRTEEAKKQHNRQLTESLCQTILSEIPLAGYHAFLTPDDQQRKGYRLQ